MFVRLVCARSLVALLLIQVTSTLALMTNGESDADLNDESVYDQLIEGTRGILCIGQLVHKDATIVMIAQLDNDGKLTKTDDIYLYQLPLATEPMGKLVLKGGQLLQNVPEWSELQKGLSEKTWSVALVSDDQYDYALAFTSDKSPLFAYNISKATSFSTGIHTPRDSLIPISSAQAKLVYFSENESDKKVTKLSNFTFSDISKDQNISTEVNVYFCNASSSSVITSNTSESCSQGEWSIRTGFMSKNQIILFDKNKTVRIFQKDAIVGKSVDVTTRKLSEFFMLSESNTTTTTTKDPDESTETNQKTAADSPTEPNRKPDPKPDPNHHHEDSASIGDSKGTNGGFIAGIVVFVIALIAIGAGAYVYCCFFDVKKDDNKLTKAGATDLKQKTKMSGKGKQTGGKAKNSKGGKAPAKGGKRSQQARKSSTTTGKSRATGKSPAGKANRVSPKKSNAGKSSPRTSQRASASKASSGALSSRHSVGKASSRPSTNSSKGGQRVSSTKAVRSKHSSHHRSSSQRASAQGMSTARQSTSRVASQKRSLKTNVTSQARSNNPSGKISLPKMSNPKLSKPKT